MSVPILQHESEQLPRFTETDILAALDLLDASVDEQGCIQRVSRLLLRLLALDSVSLYLFDQGLACVTALAHAGVTGDDAPARSRNRALAPFDVPVERAALESGRPVQRCTPDDFARYPDAVSPRHVACYSDVVLPLRASERTLGIAYLRRLDPAPPLDRVEIDLAVAVAHHAAAALGNVRTLAVATARLANLGLLMRVSEAINATLDVGSICAGLDAELSAEFRADAFLVGLTPLEGESEDEREIRLVYQRDPGAIFSGGISESLRASIWVALHAREVVNLDNRDGSQAGGSQIRDSGALCLVAARERAWSDEELRVLATIARLAALAIENARLYAGVAYERVRIGQLAVWQHALLEGGRIITQGSDLNSMIDTVARQLEVLLPHDGFAIYTFDAERRRLATVMVRAGGRRVPVAWELEPGQGLTWVAVSAGEALLANDVHLDPRAFYPPGDPIDPSRGEHEMVAPLIVEGRTVGAVCLAREGSLPFSEHEFEIFAAFAPHLAIALQTAQLAERNRSIHMSTIRALTAIIDAKDPLTAGHSERVGEIARRLAGRLGSSAAEQRTIELAGLLHDIGKVGIPDDILAKPGPLTPDQRSVMQAHPVLGADILLSTGAPELAPMVPLVRHHHERHDGGGYPDGVAGGEIPFGAAIIAVAEAYDMLTTERPYRAAESPLDALSEIQRHAGRQFHPRVVAALDAIVRSDVRAELALPAAERDAHFPAGSSPPVEIRSIAVLHRIASEISTISDLDAFLESAARIISEELDYENVDILLPRDSGAHLVVRGRVAPADRTGRAWSIPVDHGIAGQVMRAGKPAIVDGPDSAIAAPLIVEGAVVGVISIAAGSPHAFNAMDERNLTVIAAQLAPAVELARVHDQVKRAAQRDGLTGLYNHASFYAALEAALEGNAPVAVMIFDVEGLKRVNDTAGHLAGDHVLRRVAMALELETRPEDLVARYGGDEFAVIVSEVTQEEAGVMARRLQVAVNRLTWGVAQEPVSISVGFALASPGELKSTELVALADRRMYETRAHERGPLHAPRRQERRRPARKSPLEGDD